MHMPLMGCMVNCCQGRLLEFYADITIQFISILLSLEVIQMIYLDGADKLGKVNLQSLACTATLSQRVST